MEWSERPEVIKGDFGEKKVWQLIKEIGLIPYRPVFNGAHLIDTFLVDIALKKLAVCDSKTKARRTMYPDTGIDISHYQKYVNFATVYNIDDVLLFFVDELYGYIYGNTIRKLDEDGKPFQDDYRRYWNLSIMIPIARLTEKEMEYLVSHSTRNYPYPEKYGDEDFSQEDIILFENFRIKNILEKSQIGLDFG